MMMDMMLAVAPQPPPVFLVINSTIHISESSNNGEEKNVYHPLRSIGIYSISSAAMCHLWRWAVERRSSVDRVGGGHPSSSLVVPLLSGTSGHISPSRHRNSKIDGFARQAEIGTVATANIELECRQYPMPTSSSSVVG